MTLEHLETLIAFAVIMLGVSLLIMILTQMVAAFLGLRGTNLLWGLKTLLATVDQRLESHAEEVARNVLTYPLISGSTFAQFADRMSRIWGLKWILGKIQATPGLSAFCSWFANRWELSKAIRMEELVRVLKRLYPSPASTAPVEQVIWEVLQEKDPVAQTGGTARKSFGNLEAWFNTTMDRVSQRFSIQMRIWTVVLSLLVAFVAHLDAFRLLSQLSSDAELRASLASGADAMTRKAEEILAPSRAPVPSDSAEALEQLKTQYPDVAGKVGEPPVFQKPEDAVAWLRSQLGPGDQTEIVAKSYQELVQTVALRNTLDALKTQAGDIRTELAKSKFQLIPEPYHGWDFWPGWNLANRHFWGILVAASLLSLGAPFWFNAVKNLSNLRPLLTAKSAGGEKPQSQPS